MRGAQRANPSAQANPTPHLLLLFHPGASRNRARASDASAPKRSSLRGASGVPARSPGADLVCLSCAVLPAPGAQRGPPDAEDADDDAEDPRSRAGDGLPDASTPKPICSSNLRELPERSAGLRGTLRTFRRLDGKIIPAKQPNSDM
eukprot:9499530-Pyramimonas_sp.AAC.1